MIRFAKMDCTENPNICGRFKINGYPTLKYFYRKKQEPYLGQRTEEALLNFATEKGNQIKPKEDIRYLESQDLFSEKCDQKICVIAFLPSVKNVGEQRLMQYIETANTVHKSNSNRLINFFWVEGGQNFEIEEKLGLGFGFPAVVAIYLKKGIYSVMRTAYGEKNLRLFSGSIVGNGTRVNKLYGELPRFKTAKNRVQLDQEL